MSDTNLESFDGSFGAASTPMHQLDAPQHLGWASPTSSDFPEVHRGGAKFVSSPSGFALANLQAATSQADPARELAALQARMSVLQAEIATSKPPTQVQTPPPRKRTASRGAYTGTPPSKRACPATPTPNRTTQGATIRGPIEAMWSPGVTADQRRAMYDSGIGLTPNQTNTSSPAANKQTSPPPKRKAAAKKPRAPAQKRKSAPKKVPKKQNQTATFNFEGVDLTIIDTSAFTNPDESVDNKRPVSELYDQNFMSLPLSDKARLLLPLLRGIDPATGQKFAVPGALGRTAVPEPQGDALDAAAIGSLMSYISADDTATSPAAGSSPETLDHTASSPASSAPATDNVTTKDGTYISTNFFDEFHAENTVGDDSLAAIGDLFDNFISMPPTNSNTQSTACDAMEGLTSPMNFAEYLESLPIIDSAEDTLPQVDNSQIAVTGTAFDEFLTTQPGSENLLLDINSFPSDPSWWFQTDSPKDDSFTIKPFPEELTTTAATTTTSDLDAGMQIALNGAATIGSPESGAKRQREALEEHERRVTEGRRR